MQRRGRFSANEPEIFVEGINFLREKKSQLNNTVNKIINQFHAGSVKAVLPKLSYEESF